MAFSFCSKSVSGLPSLLVLIFTVCLVCLTYVVWLAYYRLFLHQLSRFPGPKLAALTLWYEFYYDVALGGQYTFRIGKMHEKYGEHVLYFSRLLLLLTPESFWLHETQN